MTLCPPMGVQLSEFTGVRSQLSIWFLDSSQFHLLHWLLCCALGYGLMHMRRSSGIPLPSTHPHSLRSYVSHPVDKIKDEMPMPKPIVERLLATVLHIYLVSKSVFFSKRKTSCLWSERLETHL
jgi:hypothetical protein